MTIEEKFAIFDIYVLKTPYLSVEYLKYIEQKEHQIFLKLSNLTTEVEIYGLAMEMHQKYCCTI